MAQTERKFRIDKYIELARLTQSESRKEKFIDMAVYYVELEEYDRESVVYKNETEKTMSDYILSLNIDDVAEHTTREVYEGYRLYCLQNGHKLLTQNKFTRGVKELRKVEAISARVNGVTARIYRR